MTDLLRGIASTIRSQASDRYRRQAASLATDPSYLATITSPARDHPNRLPSPLTGWREVAGLIPSARATFSGVIYPLFSLLETARSLLPEQFEREFPSWLSLAAHRYAAALDTDVTFEGVEAVEAASRDRLIGILLYHTSLFPDVLLPWMHPTLAHHMRILADRGNFHDHPFVQKIGMGTFLDRTHQVFIERDPGNFMRTMNGIAALVKPVQQHGLWLCISPHGTRLQRRYRQDGTPLSPGFYTVVQEDPKETLKGGASIAFSALVERARRPMQVFTMLPEGASQVVPKRFGDKPELFFEPARRGRSLRFVFAPAFTIQPQTQEGHISDRALFRLVLQQRKTIDGRIYRALKKARDIDNALSRELTWTLQTEELKGRLTPVLRAKATSTFDAMVAGGNELPAMIFDRILTIPPYEEGIADVLVAAAKRFYRAAQTPTERNFKALVGDIAALMGEAALTTVLSPDKGGQKQREEFIVRLVEALNTSDPATRSSLLEKLFADVTLATPKY